MNAVKTRAPSNGSSADLVVEGESADWTAARSETSPRRAYVILALALGSWMLLAGFSFLIYNVFT